MGATKECCQKLINDGEQTLAKARNVEVEASLKHSETEKLLEEAKTTKADAEQQAKKRVDQAQNTRVEADGYREKLLSEVQLRGELDQAQVVRVEGDSYRNRIIADAAQKSKDIMRNGRPAGEKECAELKQFASEEAHPIMEETELIKETAEEELEALCIYVETAGLETEFRKVLAEVRARDSKPSRRLDQPGEKLRRWQPDNRRHQHQSAPEPSPNLWW